MLGQRANQVGECAWEAEQNWAEPSNRCLLALAGYAGYASHTRDGAEEALSRSSRHVDSESRRASQSYGSYSLIHQLTHVTFLLAVGHIMS